MKGFGFCSGSEEIIAADISIIPIIHDTIILLSTITGQSFSSFIQVLRSGSGGSASTRGADSVHIFS